MYLPYSLKTLINLFKGIPKNSKSPITVLRSSLQCLEKARNFIIMDKIDSSNQLVKRVKLVASNGLPPLQYRIQFIDECSIEEAVRFMIEHFLPNTNMDKAVGTINDEQTVAAYSLDWNTRLRKGISLGAFLEDDAGNKGRMISCLVLDIRRKEEEEFSSSEYPSEKFGIIFRAMYEVMSKANIFKKYECDAVLLDYGLATSAEFQRRGIGVEMMEARAKVCSIKKIPVSAGVFDSEASQKLAEKCGYETLAELDLTTYRIHGKLVYHRPSWSLIKCMAIRYF
ncbi:uncharacterized protein [Bemisia tabaci]|uniref:uncharacterized protein isoform X2 n=1 Tax=Bemisia tabaci TaxID=7038 RepID=UPI003B28D01D